MTLQDAENDAIRAIRASLDRIEAMLGEDLWTYEEVDRIRSRDLRIIGELAMSELNLVEQCGIATIRAEQLEDANAALIAAHNVRAKQIATEARRYAAMYEPHSDGRNTFVIFAEWVEGLAKE